MASPFFEETDVLRSICRDSFEDFVKEFWEEIPGSGKLIWNWHMSLLCQELQIIAERVFKNQPKEYDLAVNISPGTSKPIYEEMPILMANNTCKKLAFIKAGDAVAGQTGSPCEVKQVHKQGNLECILIQTVGKRNLVCTLDHLVLTAGGWTKAGLLNVGQKLLLVFPRGSDEIISIELVGKLPCRCLSISKEYSYVVDGIVVHNSSLASILFQPWTWTQMPQARHLCSSHTDNLVLDLSNKSRWVVKSEKYQRCWPEIKIQDSVDAKGYYANTSGGDRLTCTVGGKSPTGFHGHFLCVLGSSRVMTDIGELPISQIVNDKLQVKVLGFNHETNSVEWQEIRSRQRISWANLYRVCFSNGACLYLTPDHPVYAASRYLQDGREKVVEIGIGRYIPASLLMVDDEMVCCLFVRGGNSCVSTFQLSRVTLVSSQPHTPGEVYNLGITNTNNYFANGILVHNCMDDPIDPKRAVSEAELANARDFVLNILPTRKVDKAVSVMLLIQQRLHINDPTGVMLETAKLEGAAPVKQICLPCDLRFPVLPRELKENYIDGVMDPERLSKNVLRAYEVTQGTYGFSAQFGQSPIPPSGGMFKSEFFNQRIRAAPYKSRRIRYWDRASTQDGGCRTAGVLMAKGPDGNFYVEECVLGQWEPDERNRKMLATALKDRVRYGPKNEPVIYVEAEGGSSGRDAWKGVVRALAGFSVKEDRVTGNKQVRAEPWASQLAGGTVYLVDDSNNSWDINNYILEHTLFPSGKFADQVDSSSGAFNLLVGRSKFATLYTYPHRAKVTGPRVIICDREQLSGNVLEGPSLLISFSDPEPVGTSEIPLHCLNSLLSSLAIQCVNENPVDHQNTWDDLIEPYHKKIADLLFQADQGKRLWAMLTKKYGKPLEFIVVCDEDRDIIRAQSTALAIADILRLKRETNVYWLGKDEWKATVATGPLNGHLYALVKKARGFVV